MTSTSKDIVRPGVETKDDFLNVVKCEPAPKVKREKQNTFRKGHEQRNGNFQEKHFIIFIFYTIV